MRKRKTLIVCILLSFVLCGCGNSVSDEVPMDVENEEAASVKLPETVVHEHSYVYVTDETGMHTITCSDENCEYTEIENVLTRTIMCVKNVVTGMSMRWHALRIMMEHI